MFDHILHVNKQLEMGKHFLKNILLKKKNGTLYSLASKISR